MNLHTRLFKPRVSVLWWLDRPSYILFVLRELSCVFVAWFVVYLLLLVRAVHQGPFHYEEFLAWSANPWLVALNVVSLAFVMFHAITFINLTPVATGNRVPAPVLYGVWLAVSGLLAWLVMA